MVAAIVYGLISWGWEYVIKDLEHYGSQTYPWQHNTTYIVNYSNIHVSPSTNNTTSLGG